MPQVPYPPAPTKACVAAGFPVVAVRGRTEGLYYARRPENARGYARPVQIVSGISALVSIFVRSPIAVLSVIVSGLVLVVGEVPTLAGQT